MLLKESYGYKIIEKIENIDFNISFMYKNDEMAVQYCHREKVFSVSRRESESYYVVLVGSLGLSTAKEQSKLVNLIMLGELLSIVEEKKIEEYFNKNSLHAVKYFIDSLDNDTKDRLLLSFLTKDNEE